MMITTFHQRLEKEGSVKRVILNLGAGRIVGAPSDWFKRSRDCDVGDPSFRTVFQQEL